MTPTQTFCTTLGCFRKLVYECLGSMGCFIYLDQWVISSTWINGLFHLLGSMGYFIYLDQWVISSTWINGLFHLLGSNGYFIYLDQWVISSTWINGLFHLLGSMGYFIYLDQWVISSTWINGLFHLLGSMGYFIYLDQWVIIIYLWMVYIYIYRGYNTNPNPLGGCEPNIWWRFGLQLGGIFRFKNANSLGMEKTPTQTMHENCWWQPKIRRSVHQLGLVEKISWFFKVFFNISGGSGFLNHQQYKKETIHPNHRTVPSS